MPKKYYKKRNYRKKQNGFRSLAQGVGTALKMGKLALSMLNTEEKIIDTVVPSASVTNTGDIRFLSGIAQGVDSVSRIGAEIKNKSIFMRYRLSYNTLGFINQAVRVIVFLDRQPNGVLPLTTDILETASYLSPLNHRQGKRFQVLCDDMHVLTNAQTGKFWKCYIDIDKRLKPEDQRTEYKGSGAGATDLNTNAFYVMFIGSCVTDCPLFDFYNRVKFIDN